MSLISSIELASSFLSLLFLASRALSSHASSTLMSPILAFRA